MFQYLEVRETQERGRGFFSKKDIPQGTTILEVKDTQFFTYQLLKESQLFQGIMGLTKSKVTEFAFYLAYTCKKEELQPTHSTLAEYIDNLPKIFHNLICWSDSQLKELANRELEQTIQKKKASIRQAFDLIGSTLIKNQEQLLQLSTVKPSYELCFPRRGSRRKQNTRCLKEPEKISAQLDVIKSITFDQILRFVSAIQSRNIYHATVNDNDSEVGALIPKLEMFNHSIFSKCEVECRKGPFQVTTKTHIKKGQEIFVNYGNYTLEKYLEFYGMIPQEQIEIQTTQTAPVNTATPALAKVIPRPEAEVRAELIQRYNRSTRTIQEDKE